MDESGKVRTPYYIFSSFEIMNMDISPDELKALSWNLKELDVKAYKDREAKVFDTPDPKANLNTGRLYLSPHLISLTRLGQLWGKFIGVTEQ